MGYDINRTYLFANTCTRTHTYIHTVNNQKQLQREIERFSEHLTALTFELALGLLLLIHSRLGRLVLRLGNGAIAIGGGTRSDRRRPEEVPFHRSDGPGHELLRRLLSSERCRRNHRLLHESRLQLVHGVAELSRSSFGVNQKQGFIFCSRRLSPSLLALSTPPSSCFTRRGRPFSLFGPLCGA